MSDQHRTSNVWLEAVPVDETRDGDTDEKVLRVRGYAIVFNSESERMGSVIETIDPRSLDHLGDLNALGVRMQINHAGVAIANSSKGTLRLEKDKRGVKIEADLDPRRSDARNFYYAVERGDIDKMSFRFRVAPNGEQVREDRDGTLRVHVTRIDALREVSGVDFPAYEGTELTADADEGAGAERGWDADLARRIVERERAA